MLFKSKYSASNMQIGFTDNCSSCGVYLWLVGMAVSVPRLYDCVLLVHISSLCGAPWARGLGVLASFIFLSVPNCYTSIICVYVSKLGSGPIPLAGSGECSPHTAPSYSLDTRWVSYNSSHFWHYGEIASDCTSWVLSPANHSTLPSPPTPWSPGPSSGCYMYSDWQAIDWRFLWPYTCISDAIHKSRLLPVLLTNQL